MKCLYLFSGWSEHSRAIYQNTAHDQLINFDQRSKDYRISSLRDNNFQHFSEILKIKFFFVF